MGLQLQPQLNFTKPAKSSHAHLRHLRAKGLITKGQQSQALNALQFVGYYRLLIYTRPLQDDQKRFYPGVRFDDILALYEFDRSLRLVLLDAIEQVEVAFRSAIVNAMANDKDCGPHFYLKTKHFKDMEAHRNFMKNVLGLRLTNPIKHYYHTYHTPPYPPIWTILEELSIGQMSRLLASLDREHRRRVATQFGYDEKVIVSWLKSTTMLRNNCAHHSRVWNNNIGADSPQSANAIHSEFPGNPDQGFFFSRTVALQALLKAIDPSTTWQDRFKTVMRTLPVATLSKAGITPQSIGIPFQWETRPFWN